MHEIILTLEEKEILGEHLRKSPLESVRLRSQVVLMRSAGVSIKMISQSIILSERTVTRWLKAFVEKKVSSLFSSNLNNQNASKLNKIQKEEVKKVVGQAPSEYGIPKEFWDVPKLKEYIKAEFGVIYQSDTSYHFLLKFSGLSVKYPDLVSPRKDEIFVEKRIKEIKKEIEPLLKDDNWVIFVSDETRLQSEAEIRRAWLIKGKRTVVKTERSKEHQNYLGFLDQKTNFCQIFEIDRGNTVETIRVLKKLVKQYPNQRVCVIWDNAKWHKSKQLKEELRKGKSLERLHLINLPPYAPDHNPIEHVWAFAKRKLSNRSDAPFDEIKQKFVEIVDKKEFLYKGV